jgi:Ser/Thr protein kinase RdoA (MazF antagonist)
VKAFDTLSFQGQLGRLRRLAENALAAYGVQAERLEPLAHVENTTFRVASSDGDRYVLRIHRVIGSPFHSPRSAAEVRSEMIWLSALRRDAGLAVPEPMLTTDGELHTVADVEGVSEPRVCVLLRWEPGRFLDSGLTPLHLERVGRLIARLHEHAISFDPPSGFERWRIGDVSGEAAAYATTVVREQCGPDAAALAESVMSDVQQAQEGLGTDQDVFGLIHADLHQENYLFQRGQVRAIDFDDCGWGHFAYDLMVALSELRGRADYTELRAGLLRGYRDVRPFDVDHERYLEVFHGLRLLQLTLWFIEQRDHPAFPD